MKELMDFVKELSFVRVGGSEQEKQAAELVMEEVNRAAQEAGREDMRGEYMTFRIPDAKVARCSVQAAGREIPCVPFLRSGNIDRECDLVYLDDASDIDFAGIGSLEGKAVLLNKPADKEVYKRLVDHKASAFLVMQGKYYLPEKEVSLYPRRLREHLSEIGLIPGFAITAADALWLIQEEAEKVRLTLEQEDTEPESRNILAVIQGTDLKEESIVLTAHYDSVPVGTGSWDNATGTTALLAIFRHFAANPPRRTLRFLWCGSEELGLLGSKAYVEQKEELLEKIVFCFNFDMCGTALGANKIVVTGEKELQTFAEQYCKITGYSAAFGFGVHSSDSAPFCDKEIPALGLSRESSTAVIHTIHDLLPTLSEKAMQKNVAFAVRIIGDVANAAVVPVKKGMPEETRKELDKYFNREEKKESK
ncbi:MAG: M20/M25/M40 family metallo-hydrolase [Lachnospiraceae bacterium]|uniref:M28 family metallopeptidase n=1 Tax=uncultured Acetatifactor sp. TaxID=1671927 RepID=UPI00261B6E24|nr:M28 family metallopeptidase [uncultured Acetatifactor sp.]MCI8787810.1 M20/M25/M40 family metallo-hydrolase [Lachnospiraceae bacterium]